MIILDSPVWQLPPRKIPLGELFHDMTTILVDLPYANLIDLGCVLQRTDGGELIQILAIYTGSHVPPFLVEVARGFNGTIVETHPAGEWAIVSCPTPDMRTAEEKRRDRHWWVGIHLRQCPTCGAPDQEVGERCRYCVHVIPDPGR